MITASESADTYYVYNQFDQLAYVISPKAVDEIKNLTAGASVPSTVLDNLCYQYKYDNRGRLVEKKLPGKGWEYMVYDKQDRLVLTRDAVLEAQGKWLFTKYDQFSRPIYTGILDSPPGRAQQVAAVEGLGFNNEVRTTSSFINTGMDVYYTKDLAYPQYNYTLLTINYYDSYPSYSFNPAFPTTILGEATMTDTPTIEGLSTKDLSVMKLIKNIEDNGWTKNYIYYDKKGRSIGSYSINHLGGRTQVNSKLDFTGSVQQMVTRHKRLDTDTDRVINENFIYDHQNRLLSHTHQVDSNPIEYLAQNRYNELSQLSGKKVGGISPAAPLQDISYSYNIRGWMTKINDPVNLNGKLFGYEIKYNNPESVNIAPGRFNGNIAEIDWNNGSENLLKRYDYTYDKLNRLTNAFYKEPSTGISGNFDEYLTYDLNGNISNLKRTATPVSLLTSTLVDNLDYQYTGNRLDKIIENQLNSTGYEGGNNIIDYNLNGSMINMNDKGINSIAYNYLNLPNSYGITQANPFGTFTSFSLDYLYRADGTKIRKTYYSGGGRGNPTITNNITDYLDGFQYSYSELTQCLWCRTSVAYEKEAFKDPVIPGPTFPGTVTPVWVLDFVPTAEGFYSFTENRYIYQYRDHLGNARVSYEKDSNDELKITDTNNYYAFGSNHIGGLKSLLGGYQNYKYNGKEIQETGMYDYGARFYMPDIGRWGVVDPLADKMRRYSPYNYAFNNPVKFIDPDGRAPMDEYDKFGRKISNLGGDKIDFYHQKNGDTKIVNREDGSSNLIRGGEDIIRNYEQRTSDIDWRDITLEFTSGDGPTFSMFSDFNNSNKGPFESLDKTTSNYASLARKDVLNSKNSKGVVKMDYMHANPLRSNFDMWEQMWGRSNVSWYRLGDKTLFLMTDSKSDTSLFYRVAESHERGEGYNSYPHGNTYQTYIWTETTTEMKTKVYNLFDPKKNFPIDKTNRNKINDYIKNGTP
ncbi:RHS repeat-associated core domain-containing protein [Chryseobacterium nematophagum]|uniref:RHS repeat-associated core domain-containing protein n=2 Tax=Chryseobacterium nematophagum TaxID=2305228 RepID=A0A3M7LBS3_9FLAO|nr:RHS repeat-associated core domain-containing protein [Chryseobacterium nematophagum]